ncbi:MAG: PEP/pyruvate-binding domain-containing protein, partial [Candidatus Dormiibacterota bacterium]
MAATAARTRSAPTPKVGPKYVYDFEEGNAGMRALLGGKGAGVAEMTNAGLPVPPGFTITTEACNAYMQAAGKFPAGLLEEVRQHLAKLEQRTGKRLGDPDEPLLVSVRSGAAQSMPGMMDTVLNLGLNQRSLEGLAKKTGDRRFALDAYRRFIQLFGRIVKGVDGELFERELEAAKAAAKVSSDAELSTAALTKLAEKFREIYRAHTSEPFPEEPWEQLAMAIAAVFSSWNGRRAVAYREYNHIPHNLGTAVNVQAMVFGNMGNDSGTGVAFTRDPATGERRLFGEYLLNAQGEDVVAGIRTPQPIETLRKSLPKVYRSFAEIASKLETHYRDVQDMEFTIEQGKLYMLQTRGAKRTAAAAVKTAIDMLAEGIITKEEALARVEPEQVDHLLHRAIDPQAKVRVLATGLAASPG